MHFMHKAGLALALPLLSTALISHSASAQTVGNAGFEAPLFGNGPSAYSYNTTNAGWLFSGYSGISGNSSAFTGGNPNAPQGTQVAFLQQTGVFSETISGFTAGSYVFQFDAAQRVSGTNPGHPIGGGGYMNGYSSDLQNFQVLIDGTALYGAAGVTPTVSPGGAIGGYQLYTANAVALSAGTHTLTFQGLNTAYLAAGRTGNSVISDNTAFIDAVGVNAAPVPEASTTVSLGLLLTLGLEGLAVGARQRKAKTNVSFDAHENSPPADAGGLFS